MNMFIYYYYYYNIFFSNRYDDLMDIRELRRGLKPQATWNRKSIEKDRQDLFDLISDLYTVI